MCENGAGHLSHDRRLIQTPSMRTGFFYVSQYVLVEKLRFLHSYVIALPLFLFLSRTARRCLCKTEYILRRTAKVMRLQCLLCLYLFLHGHGRTLKYWQVTDCNEVMGAQIALCHPNTSGRFPWSLERENAPTVEFRKLLLPSD